MGQNASMHKHTELELARTGISTGATVTPEMLEKLQKMLNDRDKNLAELSETVVHRTRQLIGVVGAVRPLDYGSQVAPRIDNLSEQVEELHKSFERIQALLKGSNFEQPLRHILSEMDEAVELLQLHQ